MNKRGEDQMIAVYWFFILFIVAAAIVYMVSLFYGSPYDVRELEANILIDNVADCISQKGELSNNLIESGKFKEEFSTNFIKNCKFNFNTEEEFGQDPQYYIGIYLFRISDVQNPVFDIKYGNLNLVSSCEVKNEDYEKLAKCAIRRFYSTSEGEQYLIEIVGVVDKNEKNVK